METEKYYWIIYKQKSTFESWNPVFFSESAFLFRDETFCLKLTRTVCHRIPFRHYTALLFAFWRGLCVVKGVESSVCIQFVNYNTGVILSEYRRLAGFRLWGALSTCKKHWRAIAFWPVPGQWELPLGESASREHKMPLAPNTNPAIAFNTVRLPVNQNGMLSYIVDTFWTTCWLYHTSEIWQNLTFCQTCEIFTYIYIYIYNIHKYIHINIYIYM